MVLYPAANTCAVKQNVSMDQMKRVFHILFHLSAVQKYVMQWNIHPKLQLVVYHVWLGQHQEALRRHRVRL